MSQFRFTEFPFLNETSLADEELRSLQERLFLLQKEAYRQGQAYVFLLEGWASSGKGEILKALTVRLDPRKFKVYSPYIRKSEDRGYPFLWNFWQVLPRFGESLFYLNSYYARLVYLYSEEIIGEREFGQRMLSIRNTERILSSDKIKFYKFFLHVSEKEQEKRLKKSKKDNKNWELSTEDKLQSKYYKRYRKAFERVLGESDSSFAPWTLIQSEDKSKAKAGVFQTIVRGLETDLGYKSMEMLSLIEKGQELIP